MIYENEKYKVILITPETYDEYPSVVEETHNYALINKQYNTCEATTQNLPQALTFADQFNSIVSAGLHTIWAERQAAETLFIPSGSYDGEENASTD